MYNQCIDYGEFEQSSGIFSKYSYKNFAVSTAYMKTVNSTNNNYNDNFYFFTGMAVKSIHLIKRNSIC